jgi:hypothetical protein
LTVCYLSHILIDIPTHQDEFATRILYPLSDFHIQGRTWVKDRKHFSMFWIGLIVAFILQILYL